MPNVITGTTSANETLTGTAGDDVFRLEGGSGKVIGGGGTDTVDFEDAPAGVGVRVDLTQGLSSGWGSLQLVGISQIQGSQGNDTLVGGATTTYINGLEGNNVIIGGPSSSYLTAGSGDDTITGGAGNDLIAPGGGNNRIDGGGGYDTLDYRGQPGGIAVDLYSGAWHPGGFDTIVQVKGTGQSTITNVFASDFSSIMKGDFQNNILVGGAGADTILAREGNDQITGNGGNDLIDGGPGQDVAIYSGQKANYTITANQYGWVVQDNRPGSPDGTDTVRNVETLQFADGTLSLGHNGAALDAGVLQAVKNVLREDGSYDWAAGVGASPASALADDLSAKVAAGSLSASAAAAVVVKDAADTSSVATLAYEFFTGKAPGAAGMDYLVSPTGPNANNLNSDYYQSFGLENRYINFASNLGRAGDGSAQFAAQYGNLTPEQAMTKAYQTIFGGTPSADKVNHLLHDLVPNGVGGSYERLAYFQSYGGDGPSGIGTKAAMVGWLLAEAVKADLGTYALSNDAFLTDVALHNAPYGVDIVGVYGQSGFAYQPG